MKLADLSGFYLPHVVSDHPIQRILTAALGDRKLSLLINSETLFWDASYFGLDQVSYFRAATPECQTQILQIVNRDFLEEIYWVEQAGVGYMAKMVTLAETSEERLLYGLFAADEATHLATIRYFLTEEPVFLGDPFLEYMGNLLETNDKVLLMTLVQVVLEGWGLSHYRSLAKACLSPDLAKVLQGFLEAESRHHALGVKQLQINPVYTSQSLESIYAALTHFLGMVQVGPQRLLRAIEKTLGYLSGADKTRILEELQVEHYSGTRLNLLRSLMVGAVPDSILQSLEDQGSFQPYPATQCVHGKVL